MGNDERDTFATTGGEAPQVSHAVTPNLDLAETVDARGVGEEPQLKRIGRYKVLRKLGAGGMGVVWEGKDPELDRGVAIKVLRGSGGLQLAERLRREAQALARLTHPNVVTVYDVGIDDESLYIVMQLVVGVTLDVALVDEPRTPAKIVALVAEAGRGLVAAHDAGIVHRDFKPTNVLVGADGSVRVSDFGLSRVSEDSGGAESGNLPDSLASSLTSGKVVGTPAYMAPEQFRGGPVTHATDQFAFCVTLWEALCGERPFAGSDLGSVREAVLAGRRREPRLRNRIPGRVLAVLVRGLAPEPADRFDSMSALLDALAPRRYGIKLAVGGAFLALTTSAVIAVASVSPSDPCKDVAQPADAVWSASRQATLYDALVTGASAIEQLDGHEIAKQTVQAFAARDSRWRAARFETCQATLQSPEILAKRNLCLDRSLADEHAAIELLSGKVDAELAVRALQVAANGTDPSDCARTAAFANAPLPGPLSSSFYAEIASAQAALDAGRHAEVISRRAAMDRKVAAAADPTLEAKWNDILGIAYTSVLDYANAKQVTRRAAEAATTIGDDEAAAHEWANLAELTAKSGEVAGADDSLAMARAAATRSHVHDAIVEVEISRGVVASKRGSYLEAIKICHAVIDDLAHPTVGSEAADEHQRQRDEHGRALLAHWAWGCVQHAQQTAHMAADAVASARKVLELSTQLNGPKHPETLDAELALSSSLQENGDAEAAKPIFDKAAADYGAIFGAESLPMIELLRERASSLTPAGAMTVPEALTDIQRAVAIGEKILPPMDPHRAALYETLAYIEGATRDIPATTAAYARAIAAYEKLDDPAALARVLYNAGDFPRTNGHCDVAIPLLKRASKVAADTGQKTRIEAASNAALGACLGGEKKWAEAEAVLRAAIDQQDALGDWLFGAQTRWELADELGKRGDHVQALAIAHAAADQLVDKPPPAAELRKQILEWKY